VPTEVLGVTTTSVPSPPGASVQGITAISGPGAAAPEAVGTAGNSSAALAFTGARSQLVLTLGCVLLVAGAALFGASRQPGRRRRS
jgi:hypothetical protein